MRTFRWIMFSVMAVCVAIDIYLQEWYIAALCGVAGGLMLLANASERDKKFHIEDDKRHIL